jgi:ribosomal protein S18 acetylase RimI-like enzyme
MASMVNIAREPAGSKRLPIVRLPSPAKNWINLDRFFGGILPDALVFGRFRFTIHFDKEFFEHQPFAEDHRMIRAYRPDDLSTVMDIADRAFRPIRQATRQALGDRISDGLRPEGDDVSKGLELKRQLERDPGGMLICERDGRRVGFVTFGIDRELGIGTIGNNAADPDCGERGVGQEMYQAVLERFRREGCRVAKVFTGLDDSAAAARRAYERAGFDRSLQHVTYFMEL